MESVVVYMKTSVAETAVRETLYAVAKGGVVFIQPERDFSTDFPKDGWNRIPANDLPRDAKYIGNYTINV